MPINTQLRDSASSVGLATQAKAVEAGHQSFPILAINSGSSSLRFTLFKVGESLARILAGKFERTRLPDATVSFMDIRANQSDEPRIDALNHVACVPLLVELLKQKAGDSAVSANGYCVAHGGPRYREPQRVDEAMLEELRRISSLAPNRLPAEIALLEVLATKFPQLPQIACFVTASHHTMPRVAKLLPIPRRYEAQGVQRYGFHGLSYAYLMEELARLSNSAATTGRVILVHLGNGASMVAVRDGKSIDTSMGFTPTSGLVMSTRSGDLDPGFAPYLARTEQITTSQLYKIVNHESGLLGVSEISSDVRELLARESDDVRAAEAVALFCYQAKKWIGAFVAALGGLDTLVFVGDTSENAPTVRARICEGLKCLGIEVNEERNAGNAVDISADKLRVTLRIIRTDEELMIARLVCRVLGLNAANKKD